MENRARIIAAAARVYAEFGFRGATTRRIATAAGVNEVTLFRMFGSKAALIEEAVRSSAAASNQCEMCAALLPEVPADPERELTAWATAHLERLRACRSLIRKTMAEFEERPNAAPCATEGWAEADRELRAYLRRLGDAGFVNWGALEAAPTVERRAAHAHRRGGPSAGLRGRGALALLPRNEDAEAAGAMLMAAVFCDAMGRDMLPELYPQPAEHAPALYVRLFLRAIACGERPAAARRVSAHAHGGTRARRRTSPDRTPS